MSIQTSSISQSEEAALNLKQLFENPYPGRGFIIGQSEQGHATQVYFIMGRSAGSRNRVFADNGNGRVSTELADPSQKIGNTSLTIYDAMCEQSGVAIVSNGSQTNALANQVDSGGPDTCLTDGLADYIYEPDEPNWTPRISGICAYRRHSEGLTVQISILKRLHNGSCGRSLFTYGDIPRGFGRMIMTYDGDGSPLPSFSGEPKLVPLQGDLEEIMRSYWHALNEDNRVSTVAKTIYRDDDPSEVMILNKYPKV